MRFREFIKESEGGMLRRAEESQRGQPVAFKNQAGNILTIENAKVFPESTDKVDNPDELHEQIIEYTKKEGVLENDVQALSQAAGLSAADKAGAALVMVFKNQDSNKKIAWVAYKNAKKPGAYPIFLQTKLFSDLTGYRQLGKSGANQKLSGIQERAITNLKPGSILPANTYIPVDGIPSQVSAFLDRRKDLDAEIKKQVVRLLNNVKQGETSPVENAGTYAKSYEIDLGETAAPIALATNNLLTGDWQQAEQGMDVSFDKAEAVLFPDDPAEKLYDSYLIIDKKNKIRISSKDKSGGAKASVSGVLNDISKFPERYEGLFDSSTNPGFSELLDIIKNIVQPNMSIVADSKRWNRNGSIASTLQLGIKMNVVTDTQAASILNIIDSDKQVLSDRQLGDLKNILAYKQTRDKNRSDYRIGWHLLAAVATEVANRVNEKYETDRFFKAILERSNMLQIKTTLKTEPNQESEDSAYFSNFEVIYPPVFTGTIKLDAGSNFMATRKPIGKMGFSIN